MNFIVSTYLPDYFGVTVRSTAGSPSLEIQAGAEESVGSVWQNSADDHSDRSAIDRSVGKGSVTYADGHLYLQGEDNIVGLAEATSTGYREKGRFEIPDKGQKSGAHPVISDGRLYVRNQDTLLVDDIKAGAR